MESETQINVNLISEAGKKASLQTGWSIFSTDAKNSERKWVVSGGFERTNSTSLMQDELN